jgi:hypothetical protein
VQVLEEDRIISNASETGGEDDGNDWNQSFSASETGGDVSGTGGLDSAGEEEEEEEEEGTEGEPMDLS